MRILTTPVTAEEIDGLFVGDIFYLSGDIVTGRDEVHKRVLSGQPFPVDIAGGAIFHAGPIIKRTEGRYTAVACGPTTSMRMEGLQSAFLRATGARIVIGKGGMGEDTAAACRELYAIHAVFPGGCALLSADCVEEVAGVCWEELGMPEAVWRFRVKALGPLIVSIDAHGGDLFAGRRREVASSLAGERARLSGLYGE